MLAAEAKQQAVSVRKLTSTKVNHSWFLAGSVVGSLASFNSNCRLCVLRDEQAETEQRLVAARAAVEEAQRAGLAQAEAELLKRKQVWIVASDGRLLSACSSLRCGLVPGRRLLWSLRRSWLRRSLTPKRQKVCHAT